MLKETTTSLTSCEHNVFEKDRNATIINRIFFHRYFILDVLYKYKTFKPYTQIICNIFIYFRITTKSSRINKNAINHQHIT